MRRLGRQAHFQDLQCDLSGFLPLKTFLPEALWRPYLSLPLLFGA